MTFYEIKKEAVRLNKNQYITSFLLTLIFVIPTVFFSVTPLIVTRSTTLADIRIEFILIILSLAALIYIILSTSYFFGEKAWYSGRAQNSKLGLKLLAFWYKPKYAFKAFRLKVSLFLIKLYTSLICLLPCVILLFFNILLAFTGGIEIWIFITLLCGSTLLAAIGLVFSFIINQRYFLAEYMFINNPRLKVSQAIKRSKNLLEGHVFTVVKFKLTFVPSILICPLILPLIVLRPYYKQCCSILAKELCI